MSIRIIVTLLPSYPLLLMVNVICRSFKPLPSSVFTLECRDEHAHTCVQRKDVRLVRRSLMMRPIINLPRGKSFGGVGVGRGRGMTRRAYFAYL